MDQWTKANLLLGMRLRMKKRRMLPNHMFIPDEIRRDNDNVWIEGRIEPAVTLEIGGNRTSFNFNDLKGWIHEDDAKNITMIFRNFNRRTKGAMLLQRSRSCSKSRKKKKNKSKTG